MRGNRSRFLRRGGAVVETAVVAPILMGMMLGMTEMGSAFMARQTVTNAAREGARVASIAGATLTDVNNAVATTMAAGHMTGYTVTTNLTSLGGATDVWVQVSVPFNRSSFTGSLFGGGSVNITSKASMRLEGTALDGGSQGVVQ
ncbi:MAG: TadE/TadG family type IV pilus assembly protein [Phycisphaerae bacterium]